MTDPKSPEEKINENFEAAFVLLEHLITEKAARSPDFREYIRGARDGLAGPTSHVQEGAKVIIRHVFEAVETKFMKATGLES